MKKLHALLLVLLFMVSNVFAATVKIKITYNDQPVVGHTVTALIGGNNIGQGVTNSSGELSFMVSSLATRSVDLKGEKTCGGTKKTWEVKGYVSLDNNNFAHLKMEEPINEVVEGMGGFMSAAMIVSSYGLECKESPSQNNNNSSSNNSSSNSSNNSNSSSNNSSNSTNPAQQNNTFMDSMNVEIEAMKNQYKPDPVQNASTMTREEQMEASKLHYENKVYTTGKKIEKKQEKLASPGLSKSEINDLNYEIKELELEKAIDQNKLDEMNLMIQKNGVLNKEERDHYKTIEKDLKEQLKTLKDQGKSGTELTNTENGTQDNQSEEPAKNVSTTNGSSSNQPESNSISPSADMDTITVELYIDFNPANLQTMTEDELREAKTNFTTDDNNKSLKLRLKGKWMEDAERIQLENEIRALQKALRLIEAEEIRREKQRKEDKKNK